MRPLALLSTPLLPSLTTALQIPNLQPYLSALSFPISLSDYIPPTTANVTADPQHDLLRRQFSNTCPQNFNPCDNVGAPGLCCAEGVGCAADDAGNVACCPSGAVCTGVINGVITAGTVDGNGHLVSASAGVNSDGAVVGAGAVGSGGQVFTSVGSSYVMTASGSGIGGVVAASSPSTIGPVAGASSGGAFIVDGGSTVATPGAAGRAVEVVSATPTPVDFGGRLLTRRLAADRKSDHSCSGDGAFMSEFASLDGVCTSVDKAGFSEVSRHALIVQREGLYIISKCINVT